jgi:hypothetical protein
MAQRSAVWDRLLALHRVVACSNQAALKMLRIPTPNRLTLTPPSDTRTRAQPEQKRAQQITGLKRIQLAEDFDERILTRPQRARSTHRTARRDA